MDKSLYSVEGEPPKTVQFDDSAIQETEQRYKNYINKFKKKYGPLS